ncbi:MAG: SDR family oxidoreductase [Cytophagales bacterium]|nr:MAG: SDR family oxidoreductase [Cytophagales bacterium]TAF61845.1 MAG: SDR family oxidoreductase [Cytophagales bacterium]
MAHLMPSDSFSGQTILITGGGTGLGLGFSHECLRLGANLVIVGRNQERNAEVAKKLSEQYQRQVLALAADVRHYDQLEAILPTILDKFGKVDKLINNAAGNFISPTAALSHRAFDTVVDIVLKGTYNCTLLLGKHWLEQKQKAAILNIATTYAHTGSAFVVPSACAKAGVVALTKSLAVEWGPLGIRTNALAPGAFPTKGAWERLFPENLQHLMDFNKKIPVGRVGEVVELAAIAAFLLSDYAAFINGEVLTVDGGEWLQGGGQFNFLNALTATDWAAALAATRKAKS